MIRPFRPEDASACCAIIHACLEADASYPPALRGKIRASETPQSMKERAKLFYIAVYEEEDRILGLAGLDMNEIRLLYVSPDSQRRGIGRVAFGAYQSHGSGRPVSRKFLSIPLTEPSVFTKPADL